MTPPPPPPPTANLPIPLGDKSLFLLVIRSSPVWFSRRSKNYPVNCRHGIILHNKKRKYWNEIECKSLTEDNESVAFLWFLVFFVVKCLHIREAGNFLKTVANRLLGRTGLTRIAFIGVPS